MGRPRALMIGRFQPFHLGHLHVVKQLTSTRDLILGIGSAQESHTAVNPFTAGERFDMIESALRAEAVRGAAIVPIPDIHQNSLWVSHVLRLVPRFSVFVTNNPLPARLFRERGFDVLQPPLYERHRYSATRIREALLSEKGWRDLVPAAVADVIDRVEGVARIRELAQKDS
ncbi:MAG: nicotinamide-nucleotide adenylyltransferase [Methanobacteriota archaeon]